MKRSNNLADCADHQAKNIYCSGSSFMPVLGLVAKSAFISYKKQKAISTNPTISTPTIHTIQTLIQFMAGIGTNFSFLTLSRPGKFRRYNFPFSSLFP